jgi:hypothetical protein
MQRVIAGSFRQLYSRHFIQRKLTSRFSTSSVKVCIYCLTINSYFLQKDDKPTVELDKQTLLKLERLSGLQFKNQKEVDELKEEIRLANQIFEVDTTVSCFRCCFDYIYEFAVV